MDVDNIWEANLFKISLTEGSLICVTSPHKPRNPVMEVLEDPNEDSKLRDPVKEALKDPNVGNKPRGPLREALEDLD